ncbi:MAG: hypothetical protein HZA54_02625 [Planctomycetes bacterium]|nr:hypothetical protein [Planctomycetota bacterium]
MVDGIRLAREALVARFELSQRMVTRVGALLARQVDLTASVLESARSGTLLEKVLIQPRLLTEADQLTPALLRELITATERSTGTALDTPLTVAVDGGWHTIALEEEVLAAGGWPHVPGAATAATGPSAGPSALALRPENIGLALISPESLPVVLSRQEASGLFAPEEIGRLKLTLLTSVEPKLRVEALRRLALSPLPQNEKATLALRALSDDSPEVRKEAAGLLRQLGVSPEICEAIRSVCDTPLYGKPHALERLVATLKDASPSERQVVAAVLISDFRNEKETVIQGALLATLVHFADTLAAAEPLVAALVQQIADRMAVAPTLAEPARRLFESIGKSAPPALAGFLRKEMERAPDRRSKAYYLEILSRFALPDADRARLADEVVRCVAGWNDSDPECRRLAGQLKGFGEDGVRALLAGYAAAEEPLRPFLVRTLDQLCAATDASARVMARVGAFLLEVLATAKRPLRSAVLECRLWMRPTLGADLRAKLAADFISNVHDSRLDQILDATESALERLGIPAVEPLVRAAHESPYDIEREIACKVIGKVLMGVHEPDDEVRRAAEKATATLLAIIAAGSPSAAAACRALGRVGASRAAPTGDVERLAGILRGLIAQSKLVFESVEALGWIASGANAPLPLRLEVGLIYLVYLEEQYPEDLAKEVVTAEGRVLQISLNTAAYTDLIPVIVDGLERIALAPSISATFREKVVERVLAKWYEAIAYKVIWGPANITHLGQSLGRIGASPDSPTWLRVKVLAALRERVIIMPMVESIGKVLAVPDNAEPVLAQCEEIAAALMAMTAHPDFSEREDREVILRALTEIALREQPTRDAQKADGLRRQVADLVVRAIGDDVPGAREMLRELAECERLPRAFRRAVAARMRKV